MMQILIGSFITSFMLMVPFWRWACKYVDNSDDDLWIFVAGLTTLFASAVTLIVWGGLTI